MNQEEIKKLAIECGLVNGVDVESKFLDWKKEIEAYTTAVEAPLQARIAQLKEALKPCLNHPHNNGSKDVVIKALNTSPSTWLSEHDKEVEARERERIASKIELMPLAHLGGAESIAKIVRELK